MDVFECGGTRHDGLHQLMIDTRRIEFPLHFGMGEQHLQFRAEHQHPVRFSPVERLDAEAIPHQHQTFGRSVVESKGELTP